MNKFRKCYNIRIILILVVIIFAYVSVLMANDIFNLRKPLSTSDKEDIDRIVRTLWDKVRKIGSLEEIRQMDLIDFARALGAKVISSTGISRSFFTLGEEQYRKLEILRETGQLPEGTSSNPYLALKDNSEIDGPGIYVSPSELERLHLELEMDGESMRYNKGSFLHEVLEEELLRAGIVDRVLHLYRQHADARVLEEEILFDALMGTQTVEEFRAVLVRLKEVEDSLLAMPDQYFPRIKDSFERTYGSTITIEEIINSIGENSPYYRTLIWTINIRASELAEIAQKRWGSVEYRGSL